MKKKLLLLIAIFLQLSSFAFTRFWVGKGVTNNWNNTANWSNATGGAGGSTVPVSGDNAYFDGAGSGAFKLSCTINSNVTLNRLQSDAGFTGGVINQGSFTVTINGFALNWNAGTFTGGSALFTVGTLGTDININGGIFNIGTGGFRATGTGTFNIAGGTIQTTTGTVYTDKLFTISSGTFNGGTADIRFRDKTFNLDGGTFNATSNTLFISSSNFNIRSVAGWAHNNGTVNFDSTTTTSLNFGTGPNISVDFYKVIINKTAPSSVNDNVLFTDTDTLTDLTDLDILDGQLLNATAAVKLNGNFTAQPAFSQSNVDFILAGSSNQTFNLIGATTSAMNGRLIIKKPTASLVTLLNPVTLDAGVGNTFVLEKGIVVTTVTNLLTIGDDTRCKNLITGPTTYYIEDDNSFVEGPVQKNGNDYFVFPLGNRATVSGQKAAPISISGATNNLIDLGGVNSFYANYFPVDPSTVSYNRGLKDVTINNIQSCEYWILDRLAGTANAHVWTSYKNGGHSCGPDISTDPTKLHVTGWDGTKWVDQGHGTFRQPYNYHICSNGGVTSYGPFTTASIDALVVLPVTLSQLTAEWKTGYTALNWKIESAHNFSYFSIERSVDGISYYSIGRVTYSSGNSVYGFDDRNLPAGNTNFYYRLKMAGIDGNIQYSSVILIQAKSGYRKALTVAPNPVTDKILVHITSDVTTIGSIRIVDLAGQVIYLARPRLIKGENIIYINSLPNAVPGTYVVHAIVDKEIFVQKIVVH